MSVPLWLWIATLGGLALVFAVDLIVVNRRTQEVTIGEAARWVVCYAFCALAFAGGLWWFAGAQPAGQFLAGYITEYSLSVDNLFVFLVIMSTFRVPRLYQHKVLLVGVVLALLMRGGFIVVGSLVVSRFSAVFFVFGAFLIYTAGKLLRSPELGQDGPFQENGLIRLVRKVLPVTESYHGSSSVVRLGGRRMVTPMLIVMIVIGTTDLLFALDSIPAIFGLTTEPFLVFAANAFALMGLRQLYFLIGGLLDRLVHLSAGLACVLGFIGVKLILEALHTNELPFLNGGRPLPVPVIGTAMSLAVVASILVATVGASVAKATLCAKSRQEPVEPAPEQGESVGADRR